MCCRIYVCVIALLTAISVHAFGQAYDGAPATWPIIVIEDGGVPAKWDEGHSVRVHINAAPLESGLVRQGDVIEVPSPEGHMEHFIVSRLASWVDGTYSLTAVKHDNPGEYITLSHQDGQTLGRIRSVPANSLFEIKTEPSEAGTFLTKLDAETLDRLECGVAHDHEFDTGALSALGKRDPGTLVHIPHHVEALAAAVDDPLTIDLLLLYTGSARTWAQQNVGTIELVISQAMSLSQLALDNSDVGIELRLVRAHELTYDESAVTESVVHLRRLTASPGFNPFGEEYDGFMNEVHTLRDEYGADLVAMFARISDTGGLAWRLGNLEGASVLGFSINRVQQVTTTYTLIHELGHNIGNAHSRNQFSEAAGVFGGIFPYSTGWRWEGTDGNMYASVMTYLEGSREAPLFSSPEIIHQGVPAGAYSGTFAPADSRRSMRELKRVVASYRPTQVNAPELSMTPAAVQATLAPGTQTTTSFTIANQGASDLRFDIDFARPVMGKAPGFGRNSEPSLSTVASGGGTLMSAPAVLTADAENGNIYSTTFSADDGFEAGTHVLAGMWRGINGQHSFEVSTENPAVGEQHLRMGRVEGLDGESVRVLSPYFGPHPLGAYRFSADLAIDRTDSGNYFIYFNDSRTLRVTAGFALSGAGQIFVFNEIDGTQINFVSAGRSWVPGEYRNMAVEFDPDEGVIHYYYGGSFLMSRPMEYGTSIGRMIIVHPNNDSVLDFDGVHLQSMYTGFSWMEVDRIAGSVESGQSTQIEIVLNAQELAVGEYEGVVVVSTNDPQAEVAHVPVRLTVSGEVSTGDEHYPSGYRLAQNYPNPFNPMTRIQYSIAGPEHVRLEVFSLTGQRVLTLVDRFLPGGTHSHTFDASEFSGGVYFYRLTAGAFSDVKRMVFLK